MTHEYKTEYVAFGMASAADDFETGHHTFLDAATANIPTFEVDGWEFHSMFNAENAMFRRRVGEAEDQLADADRRAGAAERELAWMKEAEFKRQRCYRERKEAVGLEENDSFDRAWDIVFAAWQREQARDRDQDEDDICSSKGIKDYRPEGGAAVAFHQFTGFRTILWSFEDRYLVVTYQRLSWDWPWSETFRQEFSRDERARPAMDAFSAQVDHAWSMSSRSMFEDNDPNY